MPDSVGQKKRSPPSKTRSHTTAGTPNLDIRPSALPKVSRSERSLDGKFWLVSGRALDVWVPVRLSVQERHILEQAQSAGGKYAITGLSEADMLQAATTVLELKRRGLVLSRIQFSTTIPGQPVAVPVELTAAGRSCLEE